MIKNRFIKSLIKAKISDEKVLKKPLGSTATDDADDDADVKMDMGINSTTESKLKKWKELSEQLSNTKTTASTIFEGVNSKVIYERYQELLRELNDLYPGDSVPNKDEMHNGVNRLLFAETEAYFRCLQIIEANEKAYAEKKKRMIEEDLKGKEKEVEINKNEDDFPLNPDEIEWL